VVKLSVIIPNLHSPMIDRTIESLLGQKTNYLYEVIVVGQDKYDLVSQYLDQVKYIRTEKPMPPGIARNLGVAAAQGDYIFFIDADCIASSSWLQEHMRVHEKFNSPVVVGGAVTFPSKKYFTLVDNVATFHEYMQHIPPGGKDQLPSLNLSLPKSVWNVVGGFNSNPAGEDSDLTMRIVLQGIPLYFEPQAQVLHLPSRRHISDLVNHAYRFGQYTIRIDERYINYLRTPFFFRCWLLLLLFSPLLALLVVLKIVICEKLPISCWHTLPVVFLIKIVWCIGASNRLRDKLNKQK